MSPLIDTSRQSSNYSERGSFSVRLLVLHATAGPLESSLDWLCSPASKVSSHYVISKTGTIYGLVAESKCAWHAGRAKWQEQTHVNEISVGIELVNANDGRDPYPAVQIAALTTLTRDLLTRYHLTPAQIARHLDVAVPAGRKSDPAGFPFAAWVASLHADPYVVRGVPIFQRSDRRGPLAGYLSPGERVMIDATYPDGGGHLADRRGFIDMAALGSPET